MGFSLDNPFIAKMIADARAEGRIVTETAAKPLPTLPATAKARAKRAKPAMVEASYSHDFLTDSWTVPCEVPSLANDREWRTRNRVSQTHRKAVSRALGTGESLVTLARYAYWFHDGKTLRVTLTRLGGKRLDKHDNLPASLKYVLDAVCLFLGADDASDLLEVVYAQLPGGATGARIMLECCDL